MYNTFPLSLRLLPTIRHCLTSEPCCYNSAVVHVSVQLSLQETDTDSEHKPRSSVVGSCGIIFTF